MEVETLITSFIDLSKAKGKVILLTLEELRGRL